MDGGEITCSSRVADLFYADPLSLQALSLHAFTLQFLPLHLEPLALTHQVLPLLTLSHYSQSFALSALPFCHLTSPECEAGVFTCI